MKTFRAILFMIFSFLVFFAYAPSMAHADLFIAPLRAVFEDRTQSATIALMNQSDKTRTYRITFVEKQQTEQGGYIDLEDIPYFAASLYLIVSPRQVTLEPGNVRPCACL